MVRGRDGMVPTFELKLETKRALRERRPSPPVSAQHEAVAQSLS